MIEQAQSFDFAGSIGIAEIDITPPIGIYNRCWGAATTYTAQWIHMPFYATVMVVGETNPLVIIGMDSVGEFGTRAKESFFQRISATLEIDESQILICASHTHSSPMLVDVDPELPGADLHADYLIELYDKLYLLTIEAASKRQKMLIQSNYGKCDLARNRDLLHEGSYVTGYNPSGEDDDTLFTARLTNEAQETIAVIVNYACHPTTLAWDNDQLSPDYIGSLRETIRKELNVPMIFIQGCSGNLGPAIGFTGDLSIPERHGRQLGFASLSSLENMSLPGTTLVLDEIKKSGADLAVWKEQPSTANETVQFHAGTIRWPIRADLLKSVAINKLLAENPDNADKERLNRKLRIRESIGEGDDMTLYYWVARMGNILIIANGGEAYSKLQVSLRARYPEYTVICANCCRTSYGYVVPEEDYEKPNLYPAWQTPLAVGIFEELYARCVQKLDSVIKE